MTETNQPEAKPEPDPIPPDPRETRPAAAGVMTWLLALVAMVVSAVLLYLTVPACGVKLFGNTYIFPWCEPRLAALTVLEQEEARHRSLDNQIHNAELALLDPDLCGPPVAPQEVVLPPEPEPIPPEPEPEIPTQEQAEVCEPGQVFQPPEEVALVVDGSGSMRFAADIPESLLNRYSEALRNYNRTQGAASRGDLAAMLQLPAINGELARIEHQMENTPGPSRATITREIVRNAVDQAPGDLPIDLTVFQDCNDITSRSYSSQERSELLNRIARLRAERGTPLAESMRIAADNLEGGDTADDPVTMVLISDGVDSCGGDPCAMAERLKREKPGLIINLLDLSQTDELRCVAEATGGMFRRGTGEVGELTELLQEQVGYSGAGQCRPAATE